MRRPPTTDVIVNVVVSVDGDDDTAEREARLMATHMAMTSVPFSAFSGVDKAVKDGRVFARDIVMPVSSRIVEIVEI